MGLPPHTCDVGINMAGVSKKVSMGKTMFSKSEKSLLVCVVVRSNGSFEIKNHLKDSPLSIPIGHYIA